MKIYKYASLESAVRILQSGSVVLSNPEDFNDPNDCAFVQDPHDKEKAEKLVTDYFIYKTISNPPSSKDIKLTKFSKFTLFILQKEMKAMKIILKKNPYFDRIPGFNLIARIMNSSSEKINDLVSTAKHDFQCKIEKAIEDTKSRALISCFSKRNNSILMWSHYASYHQGVCLEYERPNTIDFKDVKYINSRPYIKMYKVISHAIALDILGKKEVDEKDLVHLKDTLDPFFVKSTDWQYEEEVRCLYSNNKLSKNITYDGRRYFLKMDYPTAIYIGCKADGDELDHLYRLAKNRNIPVYFMKKSEKKFDIVVDEHYKYIPKKRKKPQEITLLRLIRDINQCLNHKNYVTAFSSSLIIPAICSQVECNDICDSKERYIKWCNTYLPCASKGPTDIKFSYLTGEVLLNIKEKLFSEGNINVYGHYNDFDLQKIILRIEERKGWDIYCDMLGKNDVTINVTKFCVDMIYQANRCYENHEIEIKALSQLPIEDYDERLEELRECGIISKRLNDTIKGSKESR